MRLLNARGEPRLSCATPTADASRSRQASEPNRDPRRRRWSDRRPSRPGGTSTLRLLRLSDVLRGSATKFNCALGPLDGLRRCGSAPTTTRRRRATPDSHASAPYEEATRERARSLDTVGRTPHARRAAGVPAARARRAREVRPRLAREAPGEDEWGRPRARGPGRRCVCTLRSLRATSSRRGSGPPARSRNRPPADPERRSGPGA